MVNKDYLLLLHLVAGFGPIRLKNLIDYFKDPKLAWHCSTQELLKLKIPQSVIDNFQRIRKTQTIEKYLEYLDILKINYLTIFDPIYPEILKQIYDPPLVLFYQGDINILSQKAIAIVGTRKVSTYGTMVTTKFGHDLAEAGLVIVSGLARGVDTLAHKSALDANGLTVAVLGGGLKKIFPPENIRLAQKIVEQNGLVLTEFNPDELSLPGNFPARNRIISGLSQAVLVTEAAEESGSLITARCALEQGRDVFAVPGPINSDLSKGPLFLIKQGAKLVTEPEEVLEEMGMDEIKSQKLKIKNEIKLSELEQKIVNTLDGGEKQVDEVCQQLKLSSAEVSAALVKMEIFGLIKNLGGGKYCKI